MPKYWEDYKNGERFVTPGRTIDQGMIDIIAGLAGYTLPFFWDEEASKETVYKSRIVPGRMILLMMGGLEEQARFWDDETLIALLSIDNMKIHSPLRAGDTITVECEVTGKKETSKADKGLIIHRSICKSQNNEDVAETTMTHLVKRKPTIQ